MSEKIEVVLLLDRSGSMRSGWAETVQGLNAYFDELKTDKTNKYRVSVIQFDGHNNEPVCNTLCERVKLKEVPLFNQEMYVPRGMTPLYDAMGSTISDFLAKVKKSKPVIFIAMTDGGENTSREFNATQVKNLIARAEDQNWQFVFLGADISGWSAMGSFATNIGNVGTYSKGDTVEVFREMGTRTTSYAASGAQTTADFMSTTETAVENSSISKDKDTVKEKSPSS